MTWQTGVDVADSWLGKLERGETREVWEVASLPLAIGPGELALLGGAPGSGKTAMVMQLVVDMLWKYDKLKCAVLNVEMSHESLLARIVSRIGRVDAGLLYRGCGPNGAPMMDCQKDRAKQAVHSALAALERLYFLDDSGTLADVAECARDTGARLIVLDYAQRIRPCSDSGNNARERINQLCAECRHLAQAGCGVITLSALSRSKALDGSSCYDVSGGLALFKESGELEYAVDQAWLLGPDKDAKEDTSAVVLQAAKNRHGVTGSHRLRFDRALMTFTIAGAPAIPNQRTAAAYAPGDDDDDDAPF